LWLTHQAAFEFQKNRIEVISAEIATYDRTIKRFDELETDIIKNLKTPHLSPTILQVFEKTMKQAKRDLEKRKAFYDKLLASDTILDEITKLFDKRVGQKLSNEERAKIEKEGEQRYKDKMPPGFKDEKKTTNKFGDLIIWKDLIHKSKSEKKPFILIMDDLKEDWWLRSQGRTLSPRPELLQELYEECKQHFHLYTSDQFLEFASKTDNIKTATIAEVKEIRKDNELALLDLNSSESLAKAVKNARLISGQEFAATLPPGLQKSLEFTDAFNRINSATTAQTKVGQYFKNLNDLNKVITNNSLADVYWCQQAFRKSQSSGSSSENRGDE
jgi:hypothetical protein